jgi:signal transduction histidine kinase
MLMGGFARQLLNDPGLGERARRKMSIIAQEAGRLEGLLSELNDISRPTQSLLAPLDLVSMAAHVLELMAPLLAKEGLRLRLETHGPAPRVAADRDRLGQVLINLIQNAAQASQAGQEVVLGLGPGPKGRALLTVSDQGSGISPEDLAKVFNPFFTTKKRGTGLGLPLARRIVEEHGGSLELESRPGQGTTARVILPTLPAGG